MSPSEGDEPKVRYELKGEFGAALSVPRPVEEKPHEDADAIVKNALGLTKERRNWRAWLRGG